MIRICRDSANNENENNERKIGNVQGALYSINEKSENAPEILLVSPDEYDKSINDPQKLNIFKFLVSLVVIFNIHRIL